LRVEDPIIDNSRNDRSYQPITMELSDGEEMQPPSTSRKRPKLSGRYMFSRQAVSCKEVAVLGSELLTTSIQANGITPTSPSSAPARSEALGSTRQSRRSAFAPSLETDPAPAAHAGEQGSPQVINDNSPRETAAKTMHSSEVRVLLNDLVREENRDAAVGSSSNVITL
jgi:hypothetical protein